MATLKELIRSKDPLSEDAASIVLGAREENAYVDFKVDFAEPDREWLEITKDVMAFANTEGGYLAFGIKNGTYEFLGLNEPTAKLLGDPNNWLQKVNRFVEPAFTSLRCRTIEKDGKKFVIVFIPPSAGLTHIITKEGAYKQPSNQMRTVLRQGTLYVRRSGANNLADARDLDAIFDRRLNHFRSSLLDKIARVVESPRETEILVVRQETGQGGEKKFIIEDAPDAIAVKGLSFSVAPKTSEEEIAAWIAMTSANRNALPPPETIWKWYAERRQLALTPQQRVRVAAYSILRGAPAFYWLRECVAEDIREALVDVVDRKPSPEAVADALAISAYLGKRFHKSQVGRLGAYGSRLDRRDLQFPAQGPRSYFEAMLTVKRNRAGQADRQGLEADLDDIAKSALDSPLNEPDRALRYQALRLDSFLYAQDDEYAPT